MTIVRFLGNACLEIISDQDHIIIDPMYITLPKLGIQRIFVTHQHSDHISLDKLEEIKENYAKEDFELEIYCPESVFEEFTFDFILIDSNMKINLNNGYVEVYDNNCWKTEGCVAYLITVAGKMILHTADSSNFSDQLRNIRNEIDVCFIACFEDNYNDYLEFVKKISPLMIIPYHFNQEKEHEAKKLFEFLKSHAINSRFLAIGEEIEL